jgi:hypothetical protein
MEDGEFYNQEMEDRRPIQWRWQRSEESYVMPAQNVRPTTTMSTMLDMTELMTIEERSSCMNRNRRNMHPRMSICKQVSWRICEDKDCYGCYFKMNAIVDMGTNNTKGETVKAIGAWACKKVWADSSTLEQVEHIAIFLATRPRERLVLKEFGAVRLTREEGRTIIRDKKKAFNFFALVNIKNIVYLDDMARFMDKSGEPAGTFEFYLEFGTEHTAMVFDKLMIKLNEIRIREDYTIINEINMKTKANIVLSILGLGHIFRQQGFHELRDIPFIVNLLETELRFHDMRMAHKTRGQHPAESSGSYQVANDDIEIMPVLDIDTEERMGLIIPEPTINIMDDSEEEEVANQAKRDMEEEEEIIANQAKRDMEEEEEMMMEQYLQENGLIREAQEAMMRLQEDLTTQNEMDMNMNARRMRAAEDSPGEERITTGRNVRQKSEARA